MSADVQKILDALSRIRMGPLPEEYEIHAAIAKALEESGIPYIHEYKLKTRCRIDFLCGSIGIEVKKSRPAAAQLRAQLSRYLESDALSAVIVVLQKPCSLPESIQNKRVYIVALNRLWGVALL